MQKMFLNAEPLVSSAAVAEVFTCFGKEPFPKGSEKWKIEF